MAPPFMENHHHHLLWYLDKYFSLKESMELTTETLDSQHHLPWNRETCLFVLTYVVQFCLNVDDSEFNPEMMALDEIAKSVHASYIKQQEENGDVKRTQNQGDYVDESNKKQQEFSKLLVNSFVPDVLPRFFTVPKLQQLPDKDDNLKPTEILTGFIDFLLQVLYHEAVTSEDAEQQGALALLRKPLSFLYVVLGDIPFQSGHHELEEEVINLLVEFEVLANEAGTLVYDCVFHIHLEETSRFDVRVNALSEKFELLSAKIKEHCIKFAKLPLSEISRSGVTDPFDIIPSLIVDIENLLNRRLSITYDDSIKDQIVTLHGGLKFLQTFILVSQVPPNEQKGALIQIIDLAYEVEYLISSHVVGNMHVWYLNLRLPSLIERIKLSCKGLQQNSEVHASKAMNSFENVVSLGSKEDSTTMEDNNCVDVNSDITQKNNYRKKKLDLSYKKLPYYLKPCSLYVATFPKDVEISREQLPWMWIVDGHIEEKEKRIAEDSSIAEASNLRSVSFVCIYKEKEEEILRHLLHICKLECIYGGDAIFPDINFFTELESLELCFNISLRDVIVADFNFPSTVKKLCLSGAVLTGEHMSIIGRLPNLQVLKLENHAFVGDEWELKYEDEFKELRLLKIESRDLKRWSCDSYSNFPRLKCLVVTGCTKLEIPSDVGNISPLERIEVLKCGPATYLSAFEIIEEQYVQYANYELHLVTDMERSLPEEFEPLPDKEKDQEASVDPISMDRSLCKFYSNWDTCIFVIKYVMLYYPNHREFHDVVVMGVDRIARSYREKKNRRRDYLLLWNETMETRRELYKLFVNSIIPEVQKFFNVIKLHWLSDKYKHLKPNEVLGRFIDFTLQLLHHQGNIWSDEEQLYTLIRNQLTFLLAILGDAVASLGLCGQPNRTGPPFSLGPPGPSPLSPLLYSDY